MLKIKISKLKVFTVLFFLVLLNVFIIYIPFLKTNLLPGDDSPYYLAAVNQISRLEKIGDYAWDRSTLFLMAVTFEKILNISSISSLRLLIIIMGTLLLLSVFIVSNRLFGSKVALLSVLLTEFSSSYWRMRQDLYSNFLALGVLLLICFMFILSLNSFRKPVALIMGLFLGGLFYVHNLTAFSALALIIICYGIIFLKKKFIHDVPKKFYQYFSVMAFAIFFVSSAYFLNFLTAKQSSDVYSTGAMSFSRFVNSFIKNNSVKVSLKNFPLNKNLFLTFFPKISILLLAGGLILVNYRLFLKNDEKVIIIIFPIFYYFLLTQQNYLGLNIVPDRFIFFIFPFAGITSALFLSSLVEKFLKNINWKSKTQFLFIFLLLFFLIKTLLQDSLNWAVKNIKPAPDLQEQNAYKTIGKLISQNKENSRVIFYEEHKYWFQVFNADIKYAFGEFYITCGDYSKVDSYSQPIVNSSFLLSSENPKDWLNVLKKMESLEAKETTDYIFIDKDEKCISLAFRSENREIYWQKFENDNNLFEKIYDDGRYALYRIRYENL